MKTSAIGWTDYSGGDLNFVTGCTKVSEGCKHCFAEAIYKRFKRDFSKVVVHPEKLRRLWKKRFPRPSPNQFSPKRGEPYRPMAFVCDTGDLFHSRVQPYALARVFEMMTARSDMTWQLLTKRPKYMREWVNCWMLNHAMPDNIWLGVSVSNQRTADERIPILLDIPAAVRFVSIEPMLEDLVLDLGCYDFVEDRRTPSGKCLYKCRVCGHETPAPCKYPYHKCKVLDWVIVGAESGPNRRPFDVAWAADIKRQCDAAGVAFFGKQDSGLRPGVPLLIDGQEWKAWPK